MRCRMRCWDIWRCWWPIKKAPFVPVNSMLVDVDEQTDTFSVRAYSTNEDDLHYVQLDWTSWGTVSVSYVRKWDNEYNHNIFTQSIVNSMVQTIEQSYQDWTLFDWIYTFTDGAREAISDYFAEPITPESTAEMQQALWSMPIVEDWYYTVKFVSNNTNYWTVDLELVNIRQWLERYIYVSKEEYDYNTIEWYIDIIGWEYEDRCTALPEYLGSEEYTYVFDKFTYDTATWTQVPFNQEILIDRDMTIYANFKRQKCRYNVLFDIHPERWSVSPDSVVAEYWDLVWWDWGNTFTIWSTTVTVTPVWSNIITEVDMNGSEIYYDEFIHIHMGVPLTAIWPISDVSISWIGTEATVNVPIIPYDADVEAYDFDILAGTCEVGAPEIVTSWQSTNLRFTLTSVDGGSMPGNVTYVPSYGQIECSFNIEVIAWPEYLEWDTSLTVQAWEPRTMEIYYYPEDATNVLEHVAVESDSEDLTCVLNYAYDWTIVANVLATEVFRRQNLTFYLDGIVQFTTRVRSNAPYVQSLSYSWWTLHLTVGEPTTFQVWYLPVNADYHNSDIILDDPDGVISDWGVIAENWVATYDIVADAENTWTFDICLNWEPELSINYEATAPVWPTPVQSLSYSWWDVYMPNTDTPYSIFTDVEPLDAEDWSNVNIVRLSWTEATSLDIIWVHDGQMEFIWILITWWSSSDSDTYSVEVDWVEQFQITLHWWNEPVVGWVEEVRSFFEDITPNAIKQGTFEFIINYYPITAPDATTAIQVISYNPNVASVDNITDSWSWVLNVQVSTYNTWTAEFHVLLNWDAAFVLHLNVTDTGEDDVVQLYRHRTRWTIKHNLTWWTIELADNRWNTIEILDRDLWADDYYDPDNWHYWIWYYYQRWNNYPFSNECLEQWTCSVIYEQRNASWYGPGNYYYNNELVSSGTDPETGEVLYTTWDSSLNTNLWWYDDIQSDPSLYQIANQWPCKPRTFIPSVADMVKLFLLWNYIYTWTESETISSANIETFTSHIFADSSYIVYRCYDAEAEGEDRWVWWIGNLNNEIMVLSFYDTQAIFIRPFFLVNTNT